MNNDNDGYNHNHTYQDNVPPCLEESIVMSSNMPKYYEGDYQPLIPINEPSMICPSCSNYSQFVNNNQQQMLQPQMTTYQETNYNWDTASTTEETDPCTRSHIREQNSHCSFHSNQEDQSSLMNCQEIPMQQQSDEQLPQLVLQQVYYSDDHLAHSTSNHVPQSNMQALQHISTDWLDNICKQLIEHLNTFVICVIDNFLGSICGEAIVKEVYQLYNDGLFRQGRLVNNRLVDGRLYQVRGDSMIWVDGTEEDCNQIALLIQTLDSVIINCNRMSGNNGEFDRHIINQRTKAMIACYPGNGTHYIKHIDNPNGDGRCVTSIYYLNKDWDVSRDGGLLRIYPVGIDEVANIAPLFDRVLFFWSDRRNPHEVQPAQRIRFAITVWFIDSNEKQKRQQNQSQEALLLSHQQQRTQQLLTN